MNRKLLTLIIMLAAIRLSAQLTVYTTVDEYKNKSGKSYPDYSYWGIAGSGSFGGSVLSFKDSYGKEHKFKGGEIWGFTYKDVLFRIAAKNFPVGALSTGKIVLWMNGMAYLQMLQSGSSHASTTLGTYYYLSQTQESEIMAIEIGMTHAKIPSGMKKLTKEVPSYNTVFKCIENTPHVEDIPACVQKFNSK